jgi:ABC-type multidrug transport system permease subunit
MRRIFRLAVHDVRLTVRDRGSFVWMLAMPLAFMWLFGNMGGGGGSNAAYLTVVDHDGGWLARAFVEDLGADEQIDLHELTPEDAATAENKVRTLVIPAGFTAGVLAGEPQTLRLEKEPDTSADFALAVEARSFRIVVRTLGRLVELDQAGALPEGVEPGAGAEELYRSLGAGEPAVALAASTVGEGRPVPSGRAQSVPGILTMTVVMMTLIYGAVYLTTEKQSGMLRRQMTAPVSRGQVFLGKLGGRFVLAGLQTVILLLAGRFLYGITYGKSPLGLMLLATSLCIATAGLSTLLGAVLRTPEQAGSVGWLLGMMLAAIGGCWWPSEVMPRWMWQAAHALPTAWAMDGFHALISFGYGLEGVLLPSAVLLGFGLLFAVLGSRFLRTAGGGA